MMKHWTFFIYALGICLSGHAQNTVQIDGYAALQELQGGWAVVRLPGFQQKLAILDSLVARGDLSMQAQERLEEEIASTLKERELIWRWYPWSFDSLYAFSHYAFIYTHETEAFQRGEIAARTSSGEAFANLHEQRYIFITLQGIAGDDFIFTTSGHERLSSPFPAYLNMPGILIPGLLHIDRPEWMDSHGKSNEVYRIYCHVHRLNKKLYKLYKRNFQK